MHSSRTRASGAALLAAAAALALALGACSGGGSHTATAPAAPARELQGATLPGGAQAPPFSLHDERGRAVSLRSYRGQVVVLTFLYPTCGATCALVAQQIRGALDELPRPVPTLIVSAEPRSDAPARARRLLASVSLSGRARYLSGSLAQLRRLWRAYHVIPPEQSAARFAQAAFVLLIDALGRERVVYGLEQLTPEALAHDIRELQRG